MIDIDGHKIELIQTAGTMKVRCAACPDWQPQRATFQNNAGYSYAKAGCVEDAVNHLRDVGAIVTTETTAFWTAEPVLIVRRNGKLLGYADNHGYARRGIYYRAADLASMACAVLSLLDHVAGKRHYCYETPKRIVKAKA